MLAFGEGLCSLEYFSFCSTTEFCARQFCDISAFFRCGLLSFYCASKHLNLLRTSIKQCTCVESSGNSMCTPDSPTNRTATLTNDSCLYSKVPRTGYLLNHLKNCSVNKMIYTVGLEGIIYVHTPSAGPNRVNHLLTAVIQCYE